MEHHLDELTGCFSKQQLAHDLWHELGPVTYAIGEQTVFAEVFLCCDIHHLTTYLNQFGHHGGEDVIVAVANHLKTKAEKIYRLDGDEFVLPGIGAPIDDLNNNDLPVELRQCVVDVELPVLEHFGLTAKSWIMAHLQMAMVQPAIVNPKMYCRAPPEWAG